MQAKSVVCAIQRIPNIREGRLCPGRSSNRPDVACKPLLDRLCKRVLYQLQLQGHWTCQQWQRKYNDEQKKHFYVDPSPWNQHQLIPCLLGGSWFLLTATSQIGKSTWAVALERALNEAKVMVKEGGKEETCKVHPVCDTTLSSPFTYASSLHFSLPVQS